MVEEGVNTINAPAVSIRRANCHGSYPFIVKFTRRGGVAKLSHPRVTAFDFDHCQIARPPLDGVSAIVQRGRDVGISDAAGSREESGHEFARRWAWVTHSRDVSIEAMVKDTGKVICDTDRTSCDQHGQFDANVEAATLGVSQLREQRPVRGGGLNLAELGVAESGLAKYFVPARTIGQGNVRVVLGDQSGD